MVKLPLYLDNIIVMGKTFEKHLKNLDLVFSRIRDAGLKIKPEKCSLLKEEVCYLGHIVSKDGIAADPEKLQKCSIGSFQDLPRKCNNSLDWPTATIGLYGTLLTLLNRYTN